MQADDIVEPVPGRKTSAGVNLPGLIKCKVIKYIQPKHGETNAVLELKVLEGRSTAQPNWRSSSSSSYSGYSSQNHTLGFHEYGSDRFHQPPNLSPGAVFRVFASAFQPVRSNSNRSHSSSTGTTNYKSLAGYNPPADDDLLTIMALT